MNRKFLLVTALFIVFIGMVTATVLAEISVGVKEGDWIEYQVTYTGAPPEAHAVSWAKMEVTGIQGKNINLNITVKYSDGKQERLATTLNFDTGQLGDDFIIPANLDSGNTFFDKEKGNIAISRVEERICAGARRTVVYAVTSQTVFYWDKPTGILVEAYSSFADYTMITKADKTNMWQPQTFGSVSSVFYALVIGAAVIVMAVVAFFVIRAKKSARFP